jgi:hypothetical protein
LRKGARGIFENPEINGRIIGESGKKAKKSLRFFLGDDFDDTRSKIFHHLIYSISGECDNIYH